MKVKEARSTRKKKEIETKSLEHYVFLSSSPAEIFDLLMDEEKHAAYTGGAATIERKAGGKFFVFDETIYGVTKEMKPNKLIVQTWRSDDWPDGHYSLARFELKAVSESSCELKLVHSDIPAKNFDEINEGWNQYYWVPMAEYLREQKVSVVQRFVEEFKNKANLDIVDETWTADSILHVPGFQVPKGPAGQKEAGKKIFEAFSKVHVDVLDTIVEGNRVVERHRATGVHKGSFMGIPATGKKVSWTENHIFRLENGKIAEAWSEVSFHDLLNQLRPGSASSVA